MSDQTHPAPQLQKKSQELVSIALILGQVVLVGMVLRVLKLEFSAFQRVLQLATAGFVIHHFLPHRLRLTFFVLLSIGTAFVVLGGAPGVRFADIALGLPRLGALLLLSGILIGICHLRISFWLRVALLMLTGLAAAAFRVGVWDSGNFTILWPLLAALFMFRIMIYLYDVSTMPKPPTLNQSLAYFLLIPNICTMLFPLIDFRTFCSKYYNEEALVIYQRGVKWMARGVLQLVIYSTVNLLVAIKATDVENGRDLIQFMVASSFLYLKVSGSFHLCIGMLLLFGFNLPETNHRYFLAESFTDYWRRANIYWKDFILKVFYYPAYFRIKKHGTIKATVVATVWSFFITWALHLYQTFWLKGSASWSWPDTLFWSMLGVLVLANSLWELRRGRKRMLAASRYTVGQALGLAGRTALTFAVISMLWALWNCPSIPAWWELLHRADSDTVLWGGAVLACIMVATIIFEVLPTLRAPRDLKRDNLRYVASFRFFGHVAQTGIPLVAVLVATHWLTRPERRSPAIPDYNPARDVAAILTSGADGGKGFGYYEHLASIDETDRQLWESIRREPFPRRFPVPDFWLPTDDFRFHIHIPNLHMNVSGVPFVTNRWGMHDRDYELTKEPGTLRIALLGSSHVVGAGIPTEERFEPIIEKRLNAEHGREGRFEILNFAIGGVGPLGQITTLRKEVARFKPDIVLLVIHVNDLEWTVNHIQRGLAELNKANFDFHLPIIQQARVNAKTSSLVAAQRLTPYSSQLVGATYQQLVRECHAINALPVCVFMPVPLNLPLKPPQVSELKTLAERAGFILVDLANIYDGMNPKDLMMDEAATFHSNSLANSIIAKQLYDKLTSDTRINLFERAKQMSINATSADQSPATTQ